MKTLTCIVCPRGCTLEITGSAEMQDLSVRGNQCPRGARYGIQEMTAPVRVVTSTVRVAGGKLARCPVKTAGEVPKAKTSEVVAALNGKTFAAPIARGEILMCNICGIGVDLVATRRIESQDV